MYIDLKSWGILNLFLRKFICINFNLIVYFTDIHETNRFFYFQARQQLEQEFRNLLNCGTERTEMSLNKS